LVLFKYINVVQQEKVELLYKLLAKSVTCQRNVKVWIEITFYVACRAKIASYRSKCVDLYRLFGLPRGTLHGWLRCEAHSVQIIVCRLNIRSVY